MTRDRRPRPLSAWDGLFLLGLLVLLVAWLVLRPNLPDPMPTHFDARGRADGWTSLRALPWLIFGFPLGIHAFTTLIGWATAATQADPEKARLASVGPLRGWLGLGLCLLMASTLLIPTLGLSALGGGVAILITCLVIGVVWMGVETRAAGKRQPNLDHYLLGLFYHNPSDPRVWVEKAIGVGWTLNFAHPRAILWLALLLLPVGLAVALTRC